jgi:DNA invertase Pin-like site-specific DNA recombinase
MKRAASPTPSKRVALYVRRSIDDGDATCSLPEQEKACRVYAKSIGEVVHVYRENHSGVSGFDRPVFQEMLAAGGRGEFGVIVCLDVSRFGRFDVDERGYWMTHLKRAGVDVRFVHDDARLAGEAGQIMGAVLQHSAREHSVKTSLRTTMGLIATVERGCWPGGHAPFGYRLVRREGWDGAGRCDSRLVIVEPEAKIVSEIFELYVKGKGLPTLCDILREKGYRTKGGRPFVTGTVRTLLANPVYKGDVVRGQPRRCWRRRASSSHDGAKFYHGSSHGVVPVGSETDGFAKIGAAPAIVTPELWEKAQEAARARSIVRTGGKPGPFSGIGWCGSCNGRLVARSGRTVRGVRYSYLGCRALRTGGLPRSFGDCARVLVSSSQLLERVLELLYEEARKVDPKLIAAEIRRALDVRQPEVDVAALQAKRKKLSVRRRDLVLAETEFERAALQELAAEDARLEQQIEAAKREAARTPDVDGLVAAALEAARVVSAPDTDAGTESLKAALSAFIAKVVVLPAEPGGPKTVDVTLYTVPGVALPAFPATGDTRKARRKLTPDEKRARADKARLTRARVKAARAQQPPAPPAEGGASTPTKP